MEKNPTIEVKLQRVYGNDRFYPVSEDAKTLCKILEAKTLTKSQMKVAREGGWQVVIKMEEYNLD